MADEEKQKFLTPEKREIVRMITKNLRDGAGLWRQNWFSQGAPLNATTNVPYRGVNNVYLTLLSMKRGYKDNRWATYNQMKAKGWRFKDQEGGWDYISKQAATIEYFELRDKNTHRVVDKSKLANMSKAEKKKYLETQVRCTKKVFKVYNVELMDGPEPLKISEDGKSERAEKMLNYWSDNEAKIIYGGQDSYYSPPTDTIFVPNRDSFIGYPEFYNTLFHEMAHSTGAQTRMNRRFYPAGTYGYALEEMRAEIASLFLAQQFGVKIAQSSARNSSAYLSSWMEALRDDPNCFFDAVYEAQDIAKYVAEKEKEADKALETWLTAVPGTAGVAQMAWKSDDEVKKEAADVCGAKEEYKNLFEGKRVFADPEKDTEIFLERLATVSEDREQLKRIYKSSGRKQIKESELTKAVDKAIDAIEDKRTGKGPKKKNTGNDKGGM